MGKAGPDSRILEEIAAIIMVGFGVLLFFALVSFDPADLPLYNSDRETTVNFIGPVGAYVAGGLIFVFGFASFFFPLVMFFGGAIVFFRTEIHYWWKLLWFCLLLISGATLLQIAQPVFALLPPAPGITWVGGVLGHAVADNVLAPNIGTVGAIVVTAIITLSSLVLLFEIRPIEFSILCYNKFSEWREARLQRRLEDADENERLALQKKILDEKIEKEQRKLRRQMESIQPKESKLSPAPKVIDTNIPASQPPAEPKRKEKPAPVAAGEAVDEPKALPARTARAKAPEEEPPTRDLVPVPGPALNPEDYHLPPLDLLAAKEHDSRSGANEDELRANSELIVETLRTFQIDVEPGDITRGATITRYEVKPAAGVRVERIANLGKNLARALKAEKINVLAPIPGKDTVGIEVANSQKVKVVLRELFESDAWRHSKAKLPLALGKDVYGGVLVADLAEMPHLLIGGTTGSGKSVCINCILLSLVQKFRPDELRLILVDPKVVELQVYNELPHLVVPVVTSPKKVLVALRWVINEMEKRYRTLARAGVRNISAFNSRPLQKKEKPATGSGGELPLGSEAGEEEMPERLPYIVVIVDELADLMQTVSADVETAIVRLSAKARAAGIHLILATQTPRANVITGLIKTNVPCRVAFQVPQSLDSRVILDENGAENLVGKGDMLYLPPGSSKLIRAQGAFVADDEVAGIVKFIADQTAPVYEPEIHEKLSKPVSEDGQDEVSEEEEELVEKCIEIIRQEGKASTSLLQRRLRIGYNTAARMMDLLEARGVVGPADGAKAREILLDLNKDGKEDGGPDEETGPDTDEDR